MSVKSIWDTVGHCGRFQLSHVILTQLARMLSVWGMCFMIFGSFDPGWTCITMDSDINATQQEIQRSTLFSNFSPTSRMELTSRTLYANSLRDNPYVNASPSAFVNNGTCDILNMCSNVEFDPQSSTIVTEFQLICDKKEIPQLIISVQMLGFLLGALYAGQIGERFGRKVALYSCAAIVGVVSGLSVFSPSWIVYTVLNCILHIGTGGIQTTASVFSMEVLTPWWRGTFGSIPIFNISMLLFAVVSAVLKDWMYIHLAIMGLACIILISSWFVSESVRWLIVHGKKDEAQKVIFHMAQVNGRARPDPEVMGTLCQELQENDANLNYTHLILFRDKNLRYITLKLALGWTCMIMAYYSLGFGVKSLPGDFYTNLVFGNLAEIPTVLAIGPLANKIGRPWAGAAPQFIASAFSLSIAGTQLWATHDSKETIMTCLALIAKAFSATTVSVIVTHTAELFPTAVRSLGVGFVLIVSRFGCVAAPYLIPPDMDSFPICFSIVAALMITCGISLLSLPDTKSRPLADIIPDSLRRDRLNTEDKTIQATNVCNA